MTQRHRGPSVFKYNLSKTKAKEYGARGGRKVQKYRFKIGEEHLTYEEIGARLGVTADTAAIKMKACLAKGLTPTWVLLGLQI